MKTHPHFAILSAALLACAAGVWPATRAGAFAGDNVAELNPGFVPNTGQINRGFDEKNPTSSQPRPIPNSAQTRAALAMPDNDQPVPGGGANAAAGVASPTAPAPGPIGATGQTMPAIFSQRNDVIDRVPTMALPLPLSDESRARIYRAVMADKTPAADDAARLAPAGQLTSNQALNETHPLPASVNGIAGVGQLGYIKTRSKVFLVEPNTRIVVDELDS
ncbi:MAG TPA: hypothetical protein VFW22_06915 [Pseudolabrys sp.]|nr:hypothetical protein [Pseudolabrys sp.]